MMSRKKALEESNAKYKMKLESELEDIKSTAQNIGKKALMVGAGLLAIYGLVSLFSSEKSEKSEHDEKTKPDIDIAQSPKRQGSKNNANYLGTVVKEQALIFILGLAAQKLGNFLKELEQNKKESGS
uniref:hypothetical protein n=3 Tax=Roseivirga sp. TaxID=1964215 RepID=UPI004048CA5F